MFDRPRCCDWTPLATQQLRLRNLIQVTGHNIVCKPNSSIYYTLHTTSMSSPFFTSELVDTPKNAIWSEINIQNIYEMGLKSVCIRVWQSSKQNTIEFNINQSSKQNTIESSINQSSVNITNPQDELLFLWGVYFSGLLQIPNRTNIELLENSLIFKMHGGYFTSYDYIIQDKIRKQLDFRKITNQICDDKTLFRSSSNSSIPNTSPKSGYSTLNNDDIKYPLEADTSEDILKIVFHKYQKERYLSKEFLKSEIRPSYNLEKLLRLQESQRWIRKKTQDSKDLMDRIRMKSASCLNLELIANKPFIYQQTINTKQSGMGRTLNRLLFQQNSPPNPETIIKAHKIREKIEIAKFRCRILSQERDKNKITIRHLETKLTETTDANAELESWIMSHYRSLSRERDAVMLDKIQFASQKETYLNILTSLKYLRVQLMKEINKIYVIKSDKNCFTINGIVLPDAESYTESIFPVDLSVALGYVAHLLHICSWILDVPLR